MEEILIFILIGLIAQLIDGSLGMAYGVTASSFLLSLGLPPATVSATVHAAECFSTGASGISHAYFRNIDKALFKRLLIPGVLGAVTGAYVLSSLPGEMLRPYIAVYLMVIGLIIIFKAFREFPPRNVTSHAAPLGFFGALVDALGGGGWGPIVSTSLIARGTEVRTTIGSVNAVEFFVTFAASITFFITLGFSYVNIIIGLAIGGLMGAPLGAYLCTRLPVKPLMIAVGALVISLSIYNLTKALL